MDSQNEQAGVKAVDIPANFEPGDRLELGPGTTPKQVQEAWQHLGLKKAPLQLVDHILEGSIVSALRVKLTLKVDAGRQTLSLAHDLFDAAGCDVGGMERTFDLMERSVHHSAFILQKDMQGKGIASTVIPKSIAEWRAAGLDSIKVGAGLDYGGYVWARFGFVPDAESWAVLQPTLHERVQHLNLPADETSALAIIVGSPDPRVLFTLSRTDYGPDLLRGTQWNGTLNADLYHEYLQRREQK